jgi:hypothetical protein
MPISPRKESLLAVERVGSASSAGCASAFVICGPVPAEVMIVRANVADRHDACRLPLLSNVFMLLPPIDFLATDQPVITW